MTQPFPTPHFLRHGSGWWALLSWLLLLFFAPATAPAQSDTLPPTVEPATIISDTLITLTEIKREPRNALLWGLIPGGGQVYNKRWWKVPAVYTGMLGMIAYADFNQTYYTRLTRALENRCLGEGNVTIVPAAECEPTPDAFDPARISNEALLRERARTDQARQTAYIGIFVVYLLQAVEAYTDAHLQDFDISDDLSIHLGPISQPGGMMAAGLTVPLGSGQRLKRETAEVARLKATGR
jgi:hypothetical protein